MVNKKKTVQKQIKDVVPPAEDGTEQTPEEIIKQTATTLFSFKAKFGNTVFTSPMNCDVDTMNNLIKEFKRVHDLKDLTTVSVAQFVKWAVEDRGFSVGDTEKADVLWA